MDSSRRNVSRRLEEIDSRHLLGEGSKGRFFSKTKVSSISQSNMLEVDMVNIAVIEQPVWENVFQEAKAIMMSELEDYIKTLEEVFFFLCI